MRRVPGATPMRPGGTAAWMRAARLGVLPATATPWLELMATNPVASPMRNCSSWPPTTMDRVSTTRARAVCRARTASSSLATG